MSISTPKESHMGMSSRGVSGVNWSTGCSNIVATHFSASSCVIMIVFRWPSSHVKRQVEGLLAHRYQDRAHSKASAPLFHSRSRPPRECDALEKHPPEVERGRSPTTIRRRRQAKAGSTPDSLDEPVFPE